MPFKLKTIMRYFNTTKHLKFKQIIFRLWYYVYRPKIKTIALQKIRHWPNKWYLPLATPSPLTKNGTITFLNLVGNINEKSLWSEPQKPKLWLYNLHYFDLLNSKDSEQSIKESANFIAKWIADNPQTKSIGWEPYPTSLRIVNWIKWFSRFPEKVKLPWLENLTTQIQVLEKALEYHILANHLFANCKALIFAGAYFEGPDAKRWLAKGLKIFKTEIHEQFLKDGGHFERSPMYHSTLLWDLCDLYNLAITTQIPSLLKQQEILESTIIRGLQWLRLMTHPDGELSFFNDATFNIAPRYEDLSDYAKRLRIKEIKEPLEGKLLSESGYYVASLEPNYKAILNLAPIKPNYQPGHAHADTLSFELSLFKQRFIVNSGISTYDNCALRHFQRSTKAHSTVTINSANSSDVWSSFRVAKRARPLGLAVNYADDKIVINCSHNGYKRFLRGNIHKRTWQLRPNGLIINDQICGKFKDAEARFYLHPGVIIVKIYKNYVSCKLQNNKKVEVKIIDGGELYLEPSFWYPAFGEEIKNSCITIKFIKNKIITDFLW